MDRILCWRGESEKTEKKKIWGVMASRAAFSAGRRYFASGPSPALVKVCREKIEKMSYHSLVFFVYPCVSFLRKRFEDDWDDGPDSFINRIESNPLPILKHGPSYLHIFFQRRDFV